MGFWDVIKGENESVTSPEIPKCPNLRVMERLEERKKV